MLNDIQTAPPARNGSSRPRVAFVVQRAGAEIAGGAERHCLQIAARMSQHWDTEILTTCARDYMEWKNSYPPGAEAVGGTVVRRFPVDRPRDVDSFNRFSVVLAERQAETTIKEQEQWMRDQGPVSTALLEYLQRHYDHYDAFIFFGYLYATTYFGLPLARGKAYLAPLAHDEWPIYFSMFDAMFAIPRGFIFNSQVERDFLAERFPKLPLDGEIVAVGVERPRQLDPGRWRNRYGIRDPFILYLGRIDESKGCRQLIDYFMRARQRGSISHRLILIGDEVMPVPFHDDIISLGRVDEEEKWDALAACDWLVMPSQFESLSMALLEAWLTERPVLVNGRCAVLRHQCEKSDGGLWYTDEAEWNSALSAVSDIEKRRLGRQGREYAEKFYSWDRVENAYLHFLNNRQKTAQSSRACA